MMDFRKMDLMPDLGNEYRKTIINQDIEDISSIKTMKKILMDNYKKQKDKKEIRVSEEKVEILKELIEGGINLSDNPEEVVFIREIAKILGIDTNNM